MVMHDALDSVNPLDTNTKYVDAALLTTHSLVARKERLTIGRIQQSIAVFCREGDLYLLIIERDLDTFTNDGKPS